jgi:hypothetical protein
MPKSLSQREKIFLVATVSLMFFAVAFNVFVVPMLSRNVQLNKNILASRSKLIKYMRLIKHKDLIENKYAQFNQAQGSTGSSNRIITALAQLQDLAHNAGVLIVDIRPQGDYEQAPGAEEITIDLRVEGAIQGLMKFVYNLENSLSLYDIKALQINSKANSSDLEARLTVSQPAVP